MHSFFFVFPCGVYRLSRFGIYEGETGIRDILFIFPKLIVFIIYIYRKEKDAFKTSKLHKRHASFLSNMTYAGHETFLMHQFQAFVAWSDHSQTT